MNETKMTVGVVVPTYNGGALWEKVVESLQAQRSDFDKILIIDSGSSDNTVSIAQKAGFAVEKIPSTDFDPGGTRHSGLCKIDCDIVVFLTQDTILESNAVSILTRAFDNTSVVVAYGRQLPHDNATPIAKHARLFNYKKESYLYGKQDKEKHGIKTIFTSDSFSAYATKKFLKMGGFPKRIIFGEDTYFTAKAILAGYMVNYVAEATCKHSHNNTFSQEFRRYFDIGVFHRDEAWIRETYGKATGEGLKFIKSELSYLWKQKHFFWIPIAFINNFIKILGYKIGLNYRILPRRLIIYMSSCKPFWSKLI